MNADRLLAHYERIADAPDPRPAIGQMTAIGSNILPVAESPDSRR